MSLCHEICGNNFLEKKSYRLPSRWTRAKWTQIKHTTMRKAKVLQHISILEVPVCCFLASFPRSETSLGFLSTSERCRVAPESSTLTAILNKETSAQQPLSSASEREVLGLGKILKSCSWPKRSLIGNNDVYLLSQCVQPDKTFVISSSGIRPPLSWGFHFQACRLKLAFCRGSRSALLPRNGRSARERGDFPFPLSYCRHADDVEIDSSLAKLVVEPIYKQLKP